VKKNSSFGEDSAAPEERGEDVVSAFFKGGESFGEGFDNFVEGCGRLRRGDLDSGSAERKESNRGPNALSGVVSGKKKKNTSDRREQVEN